MKKYRRLDQNDIECIAQGLTECKTASELAENLGVDVSGLIKHIKKYRVLTHTNTMNKCGKKLTCQVKNLCHARCPQKNKENIFCKRCRLQNCNQGCKEFSYEPDCKKINKFPYVCTGCSNIMACKINHYHYDSRSVYSRMMAERRESRLGIHTSPEQLNDISNLLAPLIKDKRQSLPQILLTHKSEIPVTYVTLLKYIDHGFIENVKNCDLTKRMKYPEHYKKKRSEPTNKAFLNGRTFDDFLIYIGENYNTDVVEMDTVESCRGVKACVLTLLFRKSNFMLAFLLKEKTSAEVTRIFETLKEKLGIELYSKMFGCVLTDNGSEFANPNSIEMDCKTGVKVAHLFYCDPGKSGQKGKIEKNHVELRKVFPKGFDFSTIEQTDLDLALSHINSEPRGILNGNTPAEIARVFLKEKIFKICNHQDINRDEVKLDPKLIQKKK